MWSLGATFSRMDALFASQSRAQGLLVLSNAQRERPSRGGDFEKLVCASGNGEVVDLVLLLAK